MQKIITFAAAVLMAAGIAQAAPDFIDTGRPDSYIPRVEIHGGVGVSTITQNYNSEIEGCADFFMTPGCQGVAGVTVELPLRKFLYIGTGADFNFSHYNWSMTTIDAVEGTLNTIYSRNSYQVLDIPIYIGVRFNLGKRVKWTNELGFYLSQGLVGKSRYKAYVSSTNALGQSQVSTSSYTRSYYKDDDPLINGNSRTDFGMHISTGLLLRNHWTLKAVLRTGFNNMARNNGVLDIKNHNISASLRLGYAF